MKKILIVLLALLAIATSAKAADNSLSSTTTGSSTSSGSTGFQAGDNLIRLRAVGVMPDVTSSVNNIGGHVDASNSLIPELDYSHFFTRNIAVEAIAGITTHHMSDKGSTLGTVDLGHTTLLPPTITAQYHFLPSYWVNPYLGAGINYTFFFDDGIPSSSAAKNISYSNSFGEAIQGGADFHLTGNWYANFDVKHIFLNTEVSINHGAIKANVNLDPTLVGAGVGYKF